MIWQRFSQEPFPVAPTSTSQDRGVQILSQHGEEQDIGSRRAHTESLEPRFPGFMLGHPVHPAFFFSLQYRQAAL